MWRRSLALEGWKMNEPTTLLTISAREISGRVASGELSVPEIIEEHIRRIEEANPRLNAVVVTLFDRAEEGGRRGRRPGSRGAPRTFAWRAGYHQGAVSGGRHAVYGGPSQ
jgi:hypothetical protein